MSHTIETRNPDTSTRDGRFSTSSDNRTIAQLVQDLSEQMSRLIRDEFKLAQVELTEKGKRAGMGAGLFGGAGLVALYGVAALLAAIVIGLAEVMPAWAAALIVAVVLFAVAAVMAVSGKKQVKQATPAMPEETVQSVKADVSAVKERVHR